MHRTHEYNHEVTVAGVRTCINCHRREGATAWCDAKITKISIEVFQHDWIPGFAAFYDDGRLHETARAHVVLNIGSLLGAIQQGELDRADLPYLIAESLMHEVVHVCEAWAEIEFSEERVEALTNKYRSIYGRVDSGRGEAAEQEQNKAGRKENAIITSSARKRTARKRTTQQ